MAANLDELIAEAELGDEAKRFLESDLGKALIGMARQQVQHAQISLGEIDPTDTKAIVALQNEIKLGLRFESWIRELLQNGNNAMHIYLQERNQ